MKKSQSVSDAELEVMKAVWLAGKAVPADSIIKALEGRMDWSPKTVRTLISRLVSKKALSQAKDGGVYVFRALLAESDFRMSASKSLLEKLFGASIVPMIAQFVKSQELSQDEIDDLKRILRKASKSGRE